MAAQLPLAPGVTIAEARRALADAFRAAGLDSPDLDARLLAGHALHLEHTALAARSGSALDGRQTDALQSLAMRRLAREPVARILSGKEFWGLPLRIAEATLVPRPETETVVEAALAALDRDGPRTRMLHILDLGTGSGALLLALLTELPNATGTGTDISPEALDVARGNAASLGLAARAEFIHCDFRADLPDRFDLVISNPPYVKSSDIAALPPEVRWDPRRALDGGPDGLDCYRAIAEQAPRLLKHGGHLVIELGLGQEAAVAGLLRSRGLVPSPAYVDLAGIPRALPARVATMTP
jgi:release factor glutamine methyltransferase